MSSALSSAYVLLGKAALSDPPDWSTAVGAIHTLSSLLTCSKCRQIAVPRPHATPDDSFSLICDKCSLETQEDPLLALLLDNIKHLCSYVLRAFQHYPMLDDSDNDDKDDDIVIVPTHSTSTKFVAKLRKFAKLNFDIEAELAPAGLQPAQPPTQKSAVIVTSPAKSFPNGQWIKVNTNPKPVKRSHVMINGSKFGRDQIIKTTLRPTLTYPFKPSNSKTFSRLSDFMNKPSNRGEFVVQLNQISTNATRIISASEKTSGSKKGCRCGNATPTPGKLTCGGQRCPCYVEAKSCADCKCKGCRNPHKINGEKVIRPQLQVKAPGPSTFFISSVATAPVTSTIFTTQQQHQPNSMSTFKRIHLT